MYSAMTELLGQSGVEALEKASMREHIEKLCEQYRRRAT